jgi:hypothetical protein
LDEEVFIYKTDGTSLTKKEYQIHVSTILHAPEDGEKGYSTEEAGYKIQKKSLKP